MSRLSSFWRNLVHRDRIERDLDDEVHSVYGLLADEKIQQGMPPDEARRQAMLELGLVESVKSQVREAMAGASFDVFLQDVRYAVRSLRRTPSFTLAVVVTLALGIGANTAIFTLLDAVMFKPLPLPAPHELVTLYENAPKAVPDVAGGMGRYLRFSYPRFERLQKALGSAGVLAAVTQRGTRFSVRLAGSSEVTTASGQLVSGGYFATLGASAARGRLIDASDVRPDQMGPVAVISDAFSKSAFGGVDAVVGQTVIVNGVNVTVIGITPPGFVGIWTDVEPDIWLPLTLQTDLGYLTNASSYSNVDRTQPWIAEDRIAWLTLVGRVRPADLPRATALLQAANHAGLIDLAATFENAGERSDMLGHALAVESLARGFSGLRAPFSTALYALMAMVAVVLLVTCANVANLMLARAAGRARDVAIRISLGATTGRLIRQCLTESIVLASAGGAAGLLAGVWASELLAHQVLNSSGQLPAAFALDARVLVFTAGLSLLTAVLFGLAPALRAIRAGRSAAITTTERQGVGQASMKGMRRLVAGQLALSVVVVFAAGLMGRTLINFTQMDPGFVADHLVTVRFDPYTGGYSRDQMSALSHRLVAAVTAVPGVVAASVSTCGLVANCSYTGGFRIEGGGEGISLLQNWVGSGDFAAIGLPIVNGRAFDDRDTSRSPRVAIVTESIARRFFQGQSPIGKRLGSAQLDTEIVGVVPDARWLTLREPPRSMVFFPIDQPPAFRAYPINMDVRVAGDAASAALAVRSALRTAEPGLIVDSVAAMSSRLVQDSNRERMVADLTTGFAGLALLLASVGLYGVLSYAVVQRTREIGVRMALGARRSEVAGLVVRDALRVVVGGLLAGGIAAAVTGQLLKTLLLDVSASDPAAYALALVALLAATLAAAYLPARRAAYVDPMQALRTD